MKTGDATGDGITSASLEELLAEHYDEGERQPLAPAVEGLATSLGADEQLIRVTEASFAGDAGLLAVTDRGVRFHRASDGSEAANIDHRRLQLARRDGFASQDIEVKTHAGEWLRFCDLPGDVWPSDVALLVARLAQAGPANAMRLGAELDADPTRRRHSERSSPMPRFKAIGGTPRAASSNATEQLATLLVPVTYAAAALALLWIFVLSSVTIEDVDESVRCVDLPQTIEEREDSFDDRCAAGEFDEDGYALRTYDCGTVGGTLWRSIDNETGTFIEEAIDRGCRSSTTGQALPIAVVVVVLGAAWLLGRS